MPCMRLSILIPILVSGRGSSGRSAGGQDEGGGRLVGERHRDDERTPGGPLRRSLNWRDELDSGIVLEGPWTIVL